MMTARGVGGLLGGFAVGAIGRRMPARVQMGLSGLVASLLLLAMISDPVFPVVLMLITVIGLPGIGFFVTIQTLLQAGTTDEFRGRVLGAFGTVTALFMLLGMGLASILGNSVGYVPLLDVAGVVYGISGCTVFALVHPTIVTHPEPQTRPA